MGFFSKLFGENKKEETEQPTGIKKIRAQYKNEQHFEAALEKKDENIKMYQRVKEELSQQNKVRPFNYWSIALENLDKIKLTYSLGGDIEQCKKLYFKAIEFYKNAWDKDATHADMVDMVALGVLLDIPNEYFDVIVDYVEKSDKGSSYEDWRPDALLWFMIHYKRPEKVVFEKSMMPMYNDIVALTKLPKLEAVKAMKAYLEKWYTLNRHAPWYDNHKKTGLAYKGYWCWEAAAITKIMGLDDSSYRDSPYYPYDMVHPEGGGKGYKHSDAIA